MALVKMWHVVAASAIGALVWVLMVVAASANSSDLRETATYVAHMSPAAHDEMCEVWSQNKSAVIRSLQVLNDSSAEDAALIARVACN